MQDLEELVTLTKDALEGNDVPVDANGEGTGKETSTITGTEEAKSAALAADDSCIGKDEPLATRTSATGSQPRSTANTAGDCQLAKKKAKSKTKKAFELPSHLVINSTDSEKEMKRKQRAVKQLKRKHRDEVKDYESNQKQQSWLSFSKKKLKKDSSSIFTTHDGDSKVGVVGERKKTSFRERTRHK